MKSEQEIRDMLVARSGLMYTGTPDGAEASRRDDIEKSLLKDILEIEGPICTECATERPEDAEDTWEFPFMCPECAEEFKEIFDD